MFWLIGVDNWVDESLKKIKIFISLEFMVNYFLRSTFIIILRSIFTNVYFELNYPIKLRTINTSNQILLI
jgi:hypothetical protein